jgi:flagellar M-ring protein FliF
MGNLFGETRQETHQRNYEINERRIMEERSPQVGRVTVSVNIDGTWRKMFDERRRAVIAEDGSIERIYTPVSPEDLSAADALIRDAIGFSAVRQDSVTVRNIQVDRSAQFAEEDAAYFRRRQMETTIIIFLIGLAALLIGFILVRTISREIERRKRLEAEERARREEALRQQALLQAEEEGMDISISVEERTRMELQESVINMTREHPEDAAQLIRTWLLED